MLLRWVLLLVLAWIAFELVLRLVVRAVRHISGAAPPRAAGRGRNRGTSIPAEGTLLVRCPGCGVHFPAPPGRDPKAPAYCSEECRRAATVGPA